MILPFFRSCVITICLFAVSTGCQPNASKITQEIPREVIFGNPEKTSPKISPDGRYIAYLAPDAKNVLNIWVKDLFGNGEDALVTQEKKRGIRSFFWEYTGENILYLQDQDGDENWHLYQTNVDTKETVDLASFPQARVEVIAYEPKFPDKMLVGLNVRDPSFFDVYILDLKTKSLEMVLENTMRAGDFLADHELSVRAFTNSSPNGDTLLFVRETVHSPWQEIAKASFEDSLTPLSFSLDGSSLYLLSNLHADTTSLVVLDLKERSEKVLAQDPGYDLSNIMTHPKTHEIQAVGVERDRFGWMILDPAVALDFQMLAKEGASMRIVSRDLLDASWVVLYSSDRMPAEYYLYDRNEKKLSFLFNARPKLQEYTLSKMEPISFTARDGMTIYGYLTLPAEQKEGKNLRAVLLVHGGPWARDTWGYSSYVQLLANRGYAVLQINFRGSTGFGKKYLNAGNREWAGKMQTDLLDGKKWLVDLGYADPNRVAIFGGSYGGYATLVGLSFTPKEFACGIDVVGPSNLVTLLQTIPPYWASAKAQFDVRVGNLETETPFLESRSPLFRAEHIERPLLIVQGANDPRVKQAESDQIVQAMRKNGQNVEYLLFLDEGHGLARSENMMQFSAALEAFLEKNL